MTLTINEIVAKTGDLPAMPQVALKVMKLVSDPDTSAKDLQNVIMTEPSMTLQILKIANSAMFGLKREVKTLTHAIMILGFSSIRSIVLASASKNIHSKSKGSGFIQKLMWQNSISNAFIARFLARKLKYHVEEAFIAGLMHNIGQAVLLNRAPKEYPELIQESYNVEQPLAELEKEKFNFDHTEVGYCIMQKWNLSDHLAQAVRWYPRPAWAPPEYQKLAAIVGVADIFCLQQGIGYHQPVDVSEEQRSISLELCGVPGRVWDELCEDVRVHLEQDSDTLDGI